MSLLLYIALISTFNLCVGYALGVTFGSQVELPSVKLKLPSLRRKGGGEEEDNLVQQDEAPPAAEPAAEEQPESKPALSGAIEDDEDLMSGLAAFQAQLSQMGEELNASQDDADAFGENAKHIQDANHAYLETAQQQLAEMNEGDELRESATAGVEEVGRISEEFDALVDEGLDSEEARAKLVAKSGELTEKVGEFHETQDEKTRAAAADAAAAAGLAVIDDLLDKIDEVLAEEGEPKFRSAVLIRRDPDEAEQDPHSEPGLAEKIHAKVTEIVREAAPAATIASYKEDQLLLMLEDGDIAAMTDQIDALRQQIAETTFTSGDEQLATTITCAIADVPGADDHADVLVRLREAMDESARFGANRTFHHDGKFPTPAPPAEVEVEKQTVAL